MLKFTLFFVSLKQLCMFFAEIALIFFEADIIFETTWKYESGNIIQSTLPLIFNLILYLMRIADSHWLWLVFLKPAFVSNRIEQDSHNS